MNVLCRHCFRLFDFRRVGVRCNARGCSEVLDTEGRRGPRFMLPELDRVLWRQRGRHLALDAHCPYCNERGRLVPACPRCRNPLDPGIGQVEDRMIGVLGAKDSGKSHFLSTLLHSLLYGRAGGDVWKVSMDREARRTAEERFFRPLFDDLRELPFTERGPGIELRPVLTHQGDGRQVLLVFRDLSGESMASRSLLEEVDFLRYAEGVVLLADPLALGARRKEALTAAAGRQVSCAEILDNYRAALAARAARPGEEELAIVPERKFLAVTITKADLVLHAKHSFWSPNGIAPLAPGFWQGREAESHAVHEWLHKKLADARSFAAAVEDFADASYFFVSSYGYRHTPHTKNLRKPPRPLRVHEPIFALLDRFTMGAEQRRSSGARKRGQAAAARAGEEEDVL